VLDDLDTALPPSQVHPVGRPALGGSARLALGCLLIVAVVGTRIRAVTRQGEFPRIRPGRPYYDVAPKRTLEYLSPFGECQKAYPSIRGRKVTPY
jgi:hypothetical protein